MTPSLSPTGDINNFLKKEAEKELVRLFTCGSVDDGKSTLIGRLFFDTNQIASDTLSSLMEESKTQGTNSGEFDPALLTDGLKAEREQGITIDVAYRFFSTEKRRFIVADTPGHQQYTRNMVTAASTASMAIILLDARKGVLEQTRRHSTIASLLGIRHVIVAVNKMDLVGYSQDVFEQIRKDFSDFATRLEIADLHFVPISALGGDMVVSHGSNMPWYTGGTLLHLLNTVHIGSDRNHIDFRFPVQYVTRPTSDYRGYAGTIAAGAVRPGDDVIVLPKQTKTRIRSIDTFNGSIDKAFSPMVVTLTLEDDIDVSRGDMITPVNNLTQIDDQFDVMVVWMDEEPMALNKEYLIKHTTKFVSGTVDAVRYVMDVNSASRAEGRPLALNEIGRCGLRLATPITFDSYKRSRTTGSLIIVDRLTNRTVGAGLILDRRRGSSDAESGTTVFPVFWLTGNTGAGKSTLAFAAQRTFNQEAPLSHASTRRVIVLDGDEMRETISTDEDLSPEGRRKHNLRVARLAKHLSEQGFLVLVSVIAPFDTVRSEIDTICTPVWIYVKCDGLDAADRPYEPPRNPALTIDHDALDQDAALSQLLTFLREWKMRV